jgi:predicted acylesterase/phospholipase RssA
VTKPLQGNELKNIFGAHEGTEGLAVVTMFDISRYVKEEVRYCSYYLARYSLSFINPAIKAHEDDARKNCYFHRKPYKPDILLSMNSGEICDCCMRKLNNPQDAVAHRMSDEEREAHRKMRQWISNQLPLALVMKGGGVKGLAYAGALLELQEHFWFDRHVGSSAGAIAAILLAAKYTPTELTEILLKKNFRDFLDAHIWEVPLNLVRHWGCYPGETIREWIDTLLSAKVKKLSQIKMEDLEGAIIFATQRDEGTIAFDWCGERKEAPASFAVRCSMSIPIIFFPQYLYKRRVYDAGLRTNFPLKAFLESYPGSQFIGLYLRPADNSRDGLTSDLLNIVTEGEDRKIVDKNIRNIIVIDTSPVGTVDFALSEKEKELLLRVGQAAALNFLYDRNLDNGPLLEKVTEANRKAEECRTAVCKARLRRRWLRVGWIVAIVLIGVAGCVL